MSSFVKVATCNLNQWAMDFEGNRLRIIRSIQEAKKQGCTFRTGPELEIPGYLCEDHFTEYDTFLHSWQVLVTLIEYSDGILLDIGMPVMHRNVAYNCRVFLLNRKVICIRPKVYLANDGNYRETRWFTGWHIGGSSGTFGEVEEYYLPSIVNDVTKQEKVPFGIVAIATRDTCLASETCEELFTPNSPHIHMGLDGVEIIANGSGSHHQLRKLNHRVELVKSATAKGGGVYLYANQKGCDGGRLFFDGCCMIWLNGELMAQGSQFGMEEVEVVVATVNLAEVRAFRSSFISRSVQASTATSISRVEVDFKMTCSHITAVPSVAKPVFYHDPLEEIAYGPSAWLWDYLRRSAQRGYFLPLSGGADSSSTATLVAIMCQRVVDLVHNASCEEERATAINDVRKITKDESYTPTEWQEFCGRIFFTCYMASKFSGDETRRRAKELAKAIGATHSSIFIDKITQAIQESFQELQVETGPVEQSKVKRNPVISGGTGIENIALQNIQARSRMCMSYFLAQLMPWATDQKGNPWPGALLVLGSANVDEAIRGYYTKYDCSAADINPIGGIRKTDLKAFLIWASKEKGISVLHQTAVAEPSAELTGAEGAQKDEDDMGMSYAELGDLGYVRKVEHCGPLSMFLKLRHQWSNKEDLTPSKRKAPGAQPQSMVSRIAQKVKDFYFYYAINRHKMTTLTPSYHAENYGPEDNRYDLRPFLYNPGFSWQFREIDKAVQQIEGQQTTL